LDLPTDVELLQAIANATYIPLNAMEVVPRFYHPWWRRGDVTISKEAEYRLVLVGFTRKRDAQTARTAAAIGKIPHVRLPVPTPRSGGLSEAHKIIIGTVVGFVGLLLVAIGVAASCRIRHKSNADMELTDFTRVGRHDEALIDLNYNLAKVSAPTKLTKPAVPLKQQY
ncbi:hypothetical protein TraAM80_07503, partial [Trypanosoma rangeli]